MHSGVRMHIGERRLNNVEQFKSPGREHSCLSMGQNQPKAAEDAARNDLINYSTVTDVSDKN